MMVRQATDRKKEGKIERLEFFQSLFLNLPAGTMVIDRNYAITDVNLAFLITAGMPRDQVVGRRCYEVTHGLSVPCDQVGVKCLLPEVFKTGETGACTHRHTLPDGSHVFADLLFGPLKDHRGNITHIISSARESTPLRSPSEPTEQKAGKYRLLIEKMNQGFGILDEKGRITYINPKLLSLAGSARRKLIGQPLSKFLDKPNRRVFDHEMSRRTRGNNAPYLLSWKSADGLKTSVLVSPQPFSNDEKKFAGSFAVITDMSRFEPARETLQSTSDKLERRFQKQAREIKELNIALKVLLKKRDEERIEQEEKVMLNVKEFVITYLDKLKKSGLNERQMVMAGIMESNLKDIVSPFLHGLHTKYINLSPNETQVANLIRQGKTSKEIANLLNLSPRTIESYRSSIRKKIGIKNYKINLRTYLMSAI